MYIQKQVWIEKSFLPNQHTNFTSTGFLDPCSGATAWVEVS